MRRFFLILFLLIFLACNAEATVSSSTSRIQYNCNGALTGFTFTFGVGATSEIKVVLTNSSNEETTLVETTNYSVSCTNNDCSSGGMVTTVSTYASGNKITILRNVPLTQESDFIEGQPTLYETFEDGLDKLTRIAQQHEEMLGRAALLPKSSTSSISMPRPSASKYLGWNAGATNLENKVPPTVSVAGQIGVKVSDYVNFAAAITAIGATQTTLFIDSGTNLTANTIVPATLTVQNICGLGSIVQTAAYTLTFNGPYVSDPCQGLSGFSSGQVTFGSGSVKEVYAEWWGVTGTNDDIPMLCALNSITRGKVLALAKTYSMGNPILVPNGVKLEGISEGNGTIFQAKASTALSTMIRPKAIDGTQEYFYVRNIQIDGNAPNGATFTGAVLDLQAVYNNSSVKDMVIYNYNGAPAIRVGPGTATEGSGSLYVENIWILGNQTYPSKGLEINSTYGANERILQGLYFNTVMIEKIRSANAIDIITGTNAYIKQCSFNNVWIYHDTSGYAVSLGGSTNSTFSNFRIYTNQNPGIKILNTAGKQNYNNIFINIGDYGPGGMTNMIVDDRTSYSSSTNVLYYAQASSLGDNFIHVEANSATNFIKTTRSDGTAPATFGADANGYFSITATGLKMLSNGAIIQGNTGANGIVMKDLKNSANTGVSGTAKTVEINIGGTPYYFLVYPTSAP